MTRDLPAAWRRAGAWVPLRVLNTSAQGMLLVTDEPVAVGEVIEVVVGVASGPISMTVVARFCGDTRWGRGVGVSIETITAADHERWVADYRSAARRKIDTLPGSIARHLLQRT